MCEELHIRWITSPLKTRGVKRIDLDKFEQYVHRLFAHQCAVEGPLEHCEH